VDAEPRAVDGRPEDAPEERDEFGRRGIALLAGLVLVTVLLAAIDPADPDLGDLLDAASLVTGALFWIVLLWLTYAHRRARRR
jgi:hypothetical protein